MPTSTPPDQPTPRQVIFDTGSNGALYADGLLVATGTLTDIHRKALELAGVETSTSEDFLLGHKPKNARDLKSMAAPTLEAVESFVAVRDQVAELRSRAAALEAQAAELEASLTQGRPVEPDPADPLGLGDVIDEPADGSSDEPVEEEQ